MLRLFSLTLNNITHNFNLSYYNLAMKPLQFFFLLLFVNISSYSQERFTLNGYISDAESGESLIGATVYINQISSGTITNPYGFYSITLDKA